MKQKQKWYFYLSKSYIKDLQTSIRTNEPISLSYTKSKAKINSKIFPITRLCRIKKLPTKRTGANLLNTYILLYH